MDEALRMSGIEIDEAYRAAAGRLPAGWRLDGLRCQSTGLRSDLRSDNWLAVAGGPDGAVIEGRAAHPTDALADLLRQVADRHEAISQ